MDYDLIIIGGGPAGSAAAVYAARKRMKSAIILNDFGGQSVVSEDIQNWIGTPHIPGEKLAKDLEAHVREYADDILDIHTGEEATDVQKVDGGFKVSTGDTIRTAKTVLVATGSIRRKLTIAGADEYEHKGITYCASCDGPLFSGQDVAVIGGGNAGFETAAQLLAYVKSVTLLDKGEDFRAEAITTEKILKNDAITAHHDADLLEVYGEQMVKGLKWKDTKTNEEHDLKVTGVFVEIGQVPATQFVKDLVDTTDYGQVKIDPWTQRSSVEGIWAAGDCTNVRYHQNNIACGDAVRAAEDIYAYLNT